MDSRKREHLLDQLSAYLDNELTPKERREVDAFLNEDAQARALLAELRATAQALHGLPRAEASEHLLGGVRQRLERQALLGEGSRVAIALPPERRPRFRWLAAAAVIALSLTTVYLTSPWSWRNRGTAAHPELSVSSEPPPAKKFAERGAGAEGRAEVDHRESVVAAKGGAPQTSLTDAELVHKQLDTAVREPTEQTDATLKLFANAAKPQPQAKSLAEPSKQNASAPALMDALTQRKANDGRIVAELAGQKDVPASENEIASSSSKSNSTPLVAVVELTSRDSFSQQQAAKDLTEHFAFQNQGQGASNAARRQDATTPAMQRFDQAKLATLRGGNNGSQPSPAPGGTARDKDEERIGPSLGENTMVLTRAIPDRAMKTTLQRVQSQWPGARVKMMSAQDASQMGIDTTNQANVTPQVQTFTGTDKSSEAARLLDKVPAKTEGPLRRLPENQSPTAIRPQSPPPPRARETQIDQRVGGEKSGVGGSFANPPPIDRAASAPVDANRSVSLGDTSAENQKRVAGALSTVSQLPVPAASAPRSSLEKQGPVSSAPAQRVTDDTSDTAAAQSTIVVYLHLAGDQPLDAAGLQEEPASPLTAPAASQP